MAESGEGKSKKDFLATARKRFQIACEAFDKERKWQLDDVKFAAGSPDNGWQWPTEVLNARQGTAGKPPRPTLTINKIPQHIRLVTNEQRQNRPAIKVLPVDDKSDPEVAEILNGIVRHIEAMSDADVAYDIAGECQVKSGEGYWRVVTEFCDEMSMDQDIYIKQIRNPFSVYMDPDGLRKDSTGRYIDWAFITDPITKEEFKRQYPEAQQTDWGDLGEGDDQRWLTNDKVVVAEYFYVELETVSIVQWADGSVTRKGETPGLAPMLKDGKQVEREATVRKVKWCTMSGLETLKERDWPGKYIPVVRIVGNEDEVEGEFIVSGIVRNAKDPQRMVNYWTSQEAELLALAPKAPFVGAKGQFENFESNWQAANTENFAYLEYNAIDEGGHLLPPPQRQMPPLPSAGILQAKLGSADDLQATVGQYNPSLGAEAKEKSGVAIKARQHQADVGTFHYLDNQARGVRQTGRIIIDLIPKYYDTIRVARILGEDGEPDHVTIDPEQKQAVTETQGPNGIEKIYNPSVGTYDVRVTTGPSYTTKRQEAAEFMATVLSGNKELMAVMGDLYFKMLDVPGASEIADRIKKTLPPQLAQDEKDQQEPMVQTPHGPLPLSQASQAIEQLMLQNEQAGQQMQQMQGDAQKVKEEQTALDLEKQQLLALREQIKAAERELALKEQLASEQIRNQVLEAQGGESEQKSPPGQSQPAVNVIDSAAAGPLGDLAQALMVNSQAMTEQTRNLVMAITAPRKSVLENDASGMPVAAVSEVM